MKFSASSSSLHTLRRALAASILAALLGPGCGDEGPSSAADTGVGPGIVTQPADTGSSTTDAEDGDDTAGKLDLSPSMTSGMVGESAGEDCDGLEAVLRDFEASHPDFETYAGDAASVGLVMPALGADQTPQYDPAYAGAPMITSAETFAQWYHDVPGVNQAIPIELTLVEESPGVFVYDNGEFFPLDGMGFGEEGNPHNFHFTTEVHTSFTYQGGEVFTFRGDDDLWMFVNGQLALDLGGLHPAVEGTAEMDALGLQPGETYPMDIFHAERHTNESNFRIATTIECFTTPPPAG